MLRKIVLKSFSLTRGSLTFNARSFAAKKNYVEPEYMVRSTLAADPSTIKIPYLKDHVRQEMYKLHVEDPTVWTIQKLSETYGSSIDRTKAVVFLMQNRINKAKEIASHFSDLFEDGNPNDNLTVEELLNASIKFPESFNILYSTYVEDKNADIAKLLEQQNSEAEASGSPSLFIRKTDSEVKKLLDIMDFHFANLRNKLDYDEDRQQTLERFEERGANISKFQEIPLDPSYLNSRLGMKKSRSFVDRYYPNLVNDEDYEREKKLLLERLELETKAKLIQYDMDFYVNAKNKTSDILNSNKNGIKDTANEEKIVENAVKTVQNPDNGKEINEVSRWKYAFLDLGVEEMRRKAVKQNPKASIFTLPDSLQSKTVMVSRTGKIREATPLEESMRSWHRRPSELDMQLAKSFQHQRSKLIDPFLDVDGDEELALKKVEAKLERKKKYMKK